MRVYYDTLYELCFVVRTVDDVARVAIRHAYEMFRVDIIALAVHDGEGFNVLRWRVEGVAAPLRIRPQADPGGPTYEPGQIVEIADVPAYARRFPHMQPLAERGIRSLVAAAFGMRVQGRGYLAFCSTGPQTFSDDEFTMMALVALSVGIAIDRVEMEAR